MTTKPTVVCPRCHENIDLEDGADDGVATCDRCGTSLQAAEQPGVGTPGPEHPQDQDPARD